MPEQGKNLIMLFGRPRSGTTWIAKVFDSHPDVVYRHEPEAVAPIRDVPMWIPDGEAGKYGEQLARYGERVGRMSHYRVAGKLPLLSKNHTGPIQQRLQLMNIGAARLADRVSLKLPVYDPARRAVAGGAPVVWKSVVSLGRLPALLHALPKARGVVILRHPCGYVASQLRGLSGGRFGGVPGNVAKKRLSPGLEQRAVEKYGLTSEAYQRSLPEERMAWRWLLTYDAILSQTAHLPNCRAVWYDDLCADPVNGFRDLFEFAGLEWTPLTESFVDQTTSRQRDGYYSVFKDPQRAAMRWREELPAEVAGRVLAIVRQHPEFAEWLDRQEARR